MHGDDAGEAYRLALLSDARGAYNVAADPIIDGEALGKLLKARAVKVPKQAVSAAMAGAWRLRLIPSDESLLKLFLSLPTLDCGRIRGELGWQPRHTGGDALREVMEAMAEGAGGPTPPLQPTGARSRTARNDQGVSDEPSR
jgi:nucleoside-diphosphate-sugar epimerase